MLKCVRNRILTGGADMSVSQMFFSTCVCRIPARVPKNEEVSIISREMYFSSVCATLGVLFTDPGMCL